MVPSPSMQTILWRDVRSGGVERAVLAPDPSGYHLGGTALLAAGEEPLEIRYSVLTDAAWHTRVVGLHVQGAGVNRRIALRASGSGSWTSGDDPQPGLEGAIDVDLAFSPAPNTLAIRRLMLDVGADARIDVVMIDPVTQEVTRVSQSYARLDEDTYRYEVAGVTADLVVDETGFVIDCPGAFETLARTGVGSPA